MTVSLTQAPGMGEEAADLMPGTWESAFEATSISERQLGQRLVHLAIASNGTIDERAASWSLNSPPTETSRPVPRPVVPRWSPGDDVRAD